MGKIFTVGCFDKRSSQVGEAALLTLRTGARAVICVGDHPTWKAKR